LNATNNLKTLNPYRRSGRDLLSRLFWDLNPNSWRSRAALRKWRDRHAGQKAVILCNGPSLNEVPFDDLKGTFTFGLNKIHLMFDRTDFRPSVVVAVNPNVIEQTAETYDSLDIPVFADSFGTRFIRRRNDIIFLHSTNHRGFASDCSVSVDQGYTVTYVALQLAAHFGFRDVALVGCDHYFSTKGQANKAVTAGAEDPNHFDKRYFSGGVTWDLPDLVQSEVSYLTAGQTFEELGGRVVNCTEGGRLEIFPRMALSDFLATDTD